MAFLAISPCLLYTSDLKDLFALSRKTDAVFSVTGPLQTVLTLASFLLILLYGSQRLQLARAYLRDAPLPDPG